MTFQDYQDIIDKTAIYPQQIGVPFGLAYCSLKLAGECGELVEEVVYTNRLDNPDHDRKPILKEAGDIIWYITAMCKELNGKSLESVWPNNTSGILFDRQIDGLEGAMMQSVCSICESVGKYYRDGTDINILALDIHLHMVVIMGCVAGFVSLYSGDLAEVLELNYNKLIARREQGKLQGSGSNREEL